MWKMTTLMFHNDENSYIGEKLARDNDDKL
jgi:hypothetical protein